MMIKIKWTEHTVELLKHIKELNEDGCQSKLEIKKALHYDFYDSEVVEYIELNMSRFTIEAKAELFDHLKRLVHQLVITELKQTCEEVVLRDGFNKYNTLLNAEYVAVENPKVLHCRGIVTNQSSATIGNGDPEVVTPMKHTQ
ncbi:hypothetical protein MO973_19910 [Paenibacillus sp. TRM 82003]|nr:hypothetical protein [Paenibacillus sp. TRM 82003]